MKEKKMTFEEKQKLVYGFESFGVNLLKQSEVFLFGDCENWALQNIRRTLVNIVCMAAERYGITTDYAKKDNEEYLKRLGLLEKSLDNIAAVKKAVTEARKAEEAKKKAEADEVCMAAEHYGITTDCAKKKREEFLKIRIGY